MASDIEDATTSAALVSSIRDKIAEYKAFLLRQLLEQRDTLVALDSGAGADKESGEREEKERKDEKINITTAPDAAVDGSDDTTADRNGKADDADVVAVIGDGDSNGGVSASSPASSSSSAFAAAEDVENESNRHRHTNGRAVDSKKAETITQEPAEVSDIKMKSGEDPTDTTATAISPTFAKRRIAEVSSVSAKHAKSGGVTDDNVDRKKRSRENSAADATAILEQRPAAKRVVRTSIPSRKYLDGSQHRHRQEFSGRTGVQPMLISSDGHSADGQNSQLNHRAPPRELTMEQIHGDFEKQLRDSVRISREVGSRSLSMTRKRQLPRLATPSRQKSHWDYLLEEMKWMATDFSQERNWKRAMQFHLAKDVIVAQNAEKVRQEKENRQLAREIALQVSAFWRSMERIAARSRVRFEASGSGDVSKDSELSSIAKEKQATEMEAIENAQTGVDENESGVVLKYKKIDVESGSTEERCVISAKEKMKRILSAGRKGREAMLFEAESEDSSTSSRESALEEIQSRLSSVNGSRTILAAFQVMALRWMLELYTAGLNMLLNDQLGMGKAATISAFLSLVSVLDAQSAPSPTKSSEGEAISGPHLVIVAEEELHKWQFNLRVWRREWRVQLYEGTAGYRKQLQREWKKKSSNAASSEAQFLNDSEGEELWEEENQPVFCVLCSVSAFAEDHDDFVQFSDWQMLVVENEFDDLFEDPKILAALKHIPQQSRRILCNGRPVENWKNLALRNQYAEFLLRNGSDPESEEWSSDAWTNLLLLDKPSAAQAMQSCGKTSSAVASLFKSAQQENQSHVGALLVAMYCLGLRRVRSEVESQLGKIEEQSISCKLSGSQMTQYRNAISGFAASISTMHEREERLEMWLHLFLRLRVICNCVDIVNDLDKLALADMRVIASCSTKLDALSSLLTRLVNKEEKRVVIYCQFNGMFPILEMCLTLLDVSFVRIAGSVHMQRRALSHFAERLAVKVALASTRLSCAQGTRAVSVYGADAIVVLDSDWNAICDAKLRACWAKTAVGKELVPVYRLHCEQTIEASLLRVGACFSEKVFGEMTPQELLAVPSDLLVGSALEKPSWWTSNANPGTSAANVIAKLGDVAQQAEEEEKYCGDDSELEKPLIVHNIDLDAEEHLLLSNTDELTPVEWYAVNYVHGLTDKKRVNHGGDGSGIHEDEHSSEGWTEAHYLSNARSFDELVTLENKHTWQDGDTEQQLFYQQVDSADAFAPVDEKTIEKLFSILRAKGMETHYNLYRPPQPPITGQKEVFCEPGTTDGNQMMFHVSYRVPAPPAPPAPVKIKSEQSNQVQQSETPMKAVKVKKPRNSSANVMTTGPAARPGGTTPSSTAVAGVKRKLEQQSGGVAGVKTLSTKEQRVDLEGIPLPDVAEFEDDDFWGDTNLDALDSASWDDASVLSGILGPTVDSSSSTKTSTGAGTASASQDGTTVPSQRPPKKTKGPTGTSATSTNRARKGSVSSDSGRDGWSSQDDMVLKKLFELYGSNWTLIAQVFNSTTAVSRFFCKKRSPRQCYDRYGKIISGSLSGNSSGNSSGVKDGKTSKASKASAASAVLISPEMLDARIGLPADEMLLVFSARNSLPGLPPPSIVNVPNLVEMSMRKKKMQKQLPANSPGSGDAGGMDDLKSIRNSFDAIIQCMKRKTAPPPIPIPTASTSTSDFSMKASLTATGAASFTPSPASKAAKASNSQSLAAKKAAAVPPPPHKSHMDIITLLPAGPVAPDDVIKRSKEVAAVQAAAAVASVGRDVSPLSAAGDAILGAAFGSSASLNRKQAYAGGSVGGMTSGAGSTGNGVNSRGPVSGIAHNVPGAKLATPSAGIATSTSIASTSSPAWGDMSSLHHMARGVGGSMSTIDLNSSNMIGGSGLAPGGGGLSVVGAGTPGSSGSVAGGGSGSKPPMPVTTSTLLHVLDRMPEIKNKIQTILNRNDCSEAQKVTMIARLLSNTNAINNSNVMPTSGGSTPTSSLASTQGMPNHQPNAVSVVSSSVMAMAGGIETSTSASSAIIDLETPIPMPASLASAPTSTSSHMPANAALLMESLATSPASTPNSYPPNPTQP